MHTNKGHSLVENKGEKEALQSSPEALAMSMIRVK